MIMGNSKCMICGCECQSKEVRFTLYVDCKNCGGYIVREGDIPNWLIVENPSYNSNGYVNRQKLAQFLFYNKKLGKQYLITQSDERENLPANAILLSQQMVENWYPKNFSEKVNFALLKLSEKMKYDGDSVALSYDEAKFLFFTKAPFDKRDDDKPDRMAQIDYFLNALEGFGFIEILKPIKPEDILKDKSGLEVAITPKGLEKIYELQQSHVNNKNAFVAMSFHESANEIREAIKLGIENAGYSAELMDEIIHNHQIVPEMLRLIQESRFLIMDITQPNFGAYYEAGYAQGLGKEIIVTCQKEVFNQKKYECVFIPKEDKTCWLKEVATKPHFDIAQKQILVWKDYADLTKKLSEWIKFIIG